MEKGQAIFPIKGSYCSLFVKSFFYFYQNVRFHQVRPRVDTPVVYVPIITNEFAVILEAKPRDNQKQEPESLTIGHRAT